MNPPKTDESPITTEALEKCLTGKMIGCEIYSFEQIGSTNSFAKRVARNGAPEGTLVVADLQTRGRGRLHRKWHAPPRKAICFSTVLRPNIPPEQLGLISLMTAVSVAEVLEENYKLDVDLKWPNDVLLFGKKVAGILIESEIAGELPLFAVVGVGINANQQMGDFPETLHHTATSLRIELGIEVERLSLLRNLLAGLEKNYLALNSRDRFGIRRCWTSRCSQIGSRIEVRDGEGVCQGIFAGVDVYGRMLLQTQSGRRTIHSAESGQMVKSQCS